jgi:putative acetyltransferase
MTLVISVEDPRNEDMTRLLQAHLDFCHSSSPPESVYALDVEKLVSPAITVFGARIDGALVGVGAIRQLDSDHAELKSMHTAISCRGKGIGRAMVSHLLELAKQRGVSRVSLETGTNEAFKPARDLYESFGFKPCKPFGDYLPHPISVCMTLCI